MVRGLCVCNRLRTPGLLRARGAVHFALFPATIRSCCGIDVEAVSADLTDGELTITLPKAPQPPLRRSEVR